MKYHVVNIAKMQAIPRHLLDGNNSTSGNVDVVNIKISGIVKVDGIQVLRGKSIVVC